MIVLRNIKHEHKNTAGISIFLIEVNVHKDVYFFAEEIATMVNLPIELVDESNLNANEHVILFVDFMLSFPFDVQKLSKAVSDKMEEIELKLKKDLNTDVAGDLVELALFIEQIPKIDLIYLPQVALDQQGNYTDVKILPVLDDFIISRYNIARFNTSLVSIYTYQLFDMTSGYEMFEKPLLSIITKETDEWLFDVLHFAIYHKVEDFTTEVITFQEAMKLTNEIFDRELFETYTEKNNFIKLETTDLEDKLLVVSDEQNEPLLFFVLP